MMPDIRRRRRARALLPFAAVAALGLLAAPVHAQSKTGARPAVSAASAQALENERDRTRSSLEALAADAEANAAALEALERDLAGMRQDQERLAKDLADSALRRAELDRRIADSEASLSALTERQERLRTSLGSRRTVLAEVLAALQRIGRNPPPALLVTPDDALSSVRSAILLGAVVPEIRAETEKLVRDLEELAQLRKAIATERETLQQALADNEAESERLVALSIEKLALQQESERRLAAERERAAKLSERSAELETLIASLEAEIGGLKAAAEAARKAEEDRKRRIARQLERARQLAAAQLPDKNRIAPAYAFSALKGTLPRPPRGRQCASSVPRMEPATG
jgi:Membrane-bound metallopeptidase